MTTAAETGLAREPLVRSCRRREVATVLCRPLLVHFERLRGRAALRETVEQGPLALSYLEGRDHWMSFEYFAQLLEQLAQASGASNFAAEAGALLSTPGALGSSYWILRELGSPRFVYERLAERAGQLSRVGRVEIAHIDDTSAELLYVAHEPDWNDTPQLVAHRRGQLESVPTIFGLPPASCSTSSELREGAALHRYRLRWEPLRQRHARDPRLVGATLASVGIGLLLPQVALPTWLLTGVLLPAATYAGGLALLRARAQRSRSHERAAVLEELLDSSRERTAALELANVELEALREQLQAKVAAQNDELEKKLAQLSRAYAELERLSSIDGLTGLLLRRVVDERLGPLLPGRPASPPLSLFLFDLDHFKQINDQHGHAMGDLVLSTVGKLMQRQLPPPALCARYGGEEFLVALPGSTLLEAGFAIDALVAALREANPAPSIPELKIRISGGLVAYRPEADKSLEDAVRRADQLLYTAKRAGRDRYYRDGDELPTFTSRRASDRPPSTG